MVTQLHVIDPSQKGLRNLLEVEEMPDRANLLEVEGMPDRAKAQLRDNCERLRDHFLRKVDLKYGGIPQRLTKTYISLGNVSLLPTDGVRKNNMKNSKVTNALGLALQGY